RACAGGCADGCRRDRAVRAEGGGGRVCRPGTAGWALSAAIGCGDFWGIGQGAGRMSAPSVVRIRRMSAADLERVLGIAESLPQAPQWPASAYIAAMDTGNTPRRIALVAECVSGEERDSREVPENQTSGAKAQTRLAESDAGTKVP